MAGNGNPVHVRWKGHKKNVRKNIGFRPEYAELIDYLCAKRKMSQRELIEEALKVAFGDPAKAAILDTKEIKCNHQ